MITYEMQPFPEHQGVNIRVTGDLVGGDIPVDTDNLEGGRHFQVYDSYHVSDFEPMVELVKEYLSTDVQPTKHLKAKVGRIVMSFMPVASLEQSLEFKVYEGLNYINRHGDKVVGCFAEDPQNPDYTFFTFMQIEGDEDVLDIDTELPEDAVYCFPAMAVRKDNLEAFEEIIAESKAALA